MKFRVSISFVIIISGIIIFTRCHSEPEALDNLSKEKYELINQSGESVIFPKMINGKIALVNYIFTNCPDICPLSTNNMRLIQERLEKEKISNVEFVSISFDPIQDSPFTLRKFADIRNLDLTNWSFLTGNKVTIDSLMRRIGIMAVVGDSTVFKDGRKIYYYIHTDRISLFDTEGKIRKHYLGSKAPIEEIVSDIKNLVN